MTNLLHRAARMLLTRLTGVDLAAQFESAQRGHLRIGALEDKLALLTRQNAELREALRPTAGTVVRWRGERVS